jgi:hypothetical protein
MTSIVLENSFHMHDIEDDSKSLEYEYENILRTIGLGSSLNNTNLLRLRLTYAYNITNSEKTSFINDPILSYWRRISEAEDQTDISGDFGVEFIPLISKKSSKQPFFGNTLILKYRFGIDDQKNNLHATYFIGLQEGRSFSEVGQRRKVSSSTFYGIDLNYQYFFNQRFSTGARLSFQKDSEHSGTAYFQNSEFTSSWTMEYNVFVSYLFRPEMALTLNFLSSDEAPSANKFKRSRDLDVEEKRVLLSLKINELDL